MGEKVTAWGAQCPTCDYKNDMPLECLREHFQDLECDHCGEHLEYRGRHIADGDFEIITRTIATPHDGGQ